MNVHNNTQLLMHRSILHLKEFSCDTPLLKILEFTKFSTNASSSSKQNLHALTERMIPFSHIDSLTSHQESDATLTLTKRNTMYVFR